MLNIWSKVIQNLNKLVSYLSEGDCLRNIRALFVIARNHQRAANSNATKLPLNARQKPGVRLLSSSNIHFCEPI